MATPEVATPVEAPDPKQTAISEYGRLMLQHKELDARVRKLRDEVKETKKQFDKTEDDLKALQSMGQIIGEVLRQLDEERCASTPPHPTKKLPPLLPPPPAPAP